ncbi:MULTISPECIES: Holliday junction resolvase RuvX [Methylobacterium]|uniref:Holliday junction resolvase RuvX n=1 Tax=Methylobacterium TaxID=407 RepID=UPI000CB170F1|nr:MULTISPECIES: Holliday junction resolvase RuvX [Methylobacterium]PIU08357.1 MAG: Holliday junction resolvase RuvX [Methylobacterium sp. CG09_land_8_20_14_0_10_71_15]PIU13538.1 MAG: Holliday junction resolvase RuvX [Methylobacterium sp. CG08_land_8_20_14_0_20_71_15]
MDHDALRAFAETVSAQAARGLPRLIGIDLGTKTIGLALSDVGRSIASPLETIRRVKFTPDAQRLKALCEQHGVGGLVMGLPLNMDGSEGPRAQSSRAFMRNLKGLLDLPSVFFDERLSTAVVTRALIEADASRARRGELVDKLAATYILQGCLDVMAELSGDAPDEVPKGDRFPFS